MVKQKKLPSPISILVVVILLAAAATWLLPAGEYDKLSYADNAFSIVSAKGERILPATQRTLDSLGIRIPLTRFTDKDIRKPVAVPGSYHQLPGNGQGAVSIIQAPIRGIYETIDIILFILFIGGFMHVFQKTGAMEQGVRRLAHRMKGREAWLIIIMTTLFAAGGSSFGMAEECLIFYPALVPLFLAAGYDLLVPVATVIGGATLGNISSFSNPFATIIASNAAGINWTDGLIERLAVFVAVGFVYIWYLVRYAQKVQRDPTTSLVYRIDGLASSPFAQPERGYDGTLSRRDKFLLVLFFITFMVMIAGVGAFGWGSTEMTAVFMVAAIIIAIITRTNENVFIDLFINGARELLSVAFIIGIARGVGLILNDGHIADSILYYSSGLVGNMPPVLFVLILFSLYLIFTLFISSSSGMAVLTMPIFGSMAVMAGAPGREVVNAYLFGMGIMSFLTPTGLILPTLALVGISYKSWLKFIWPVLLVMTGICCLFLIGVVMTEA